MTPIAADTAAPLRVSVGLREVCDNEIQGIGFEFAMKLS
jgi:hypothetical protein